MVRGLPLLFSVVDPEYFNRCSVKYLFALMLIICAPCHGQTAATPPCFPRQIGGTGTAAIISETPTTVQAGWSCAVKGKTVNWGIVRVKWFELKLVNVGGMTPLAAFKAMYAANAKTAASHPDLKPGWAALKAQFP